MRKKWRRKLTVLVATVLACWGLPGCDRTLEMSDDARITSAMGAVEGEGEDIEWQVQANEEEAETAWPEGSFFP